jgi:hypothetical protein
MMWTYPDGSERRLYDEIKSGRKTSEWRDFKPFWIKRLLKKTEDISHIVKGFGVSDTIELTGGLRVGRAWFVEGFPKNSLPRLEAIITDLLYHNTGHLLNNDTGQFEIKFKDVIEILH